MNVIQHCAIDIAADCDYDWIVENLLNGNLLNNFIFLPNGESVLYAQHTINKIIAEEILHDRYSITTAANSTLQSMSSGEQKKALLQYIISKKPAFIVMDNVLDNLDTAAQESIIVLLQQLAQHTLIVQIINRVKDIQPFITTVFSVKGNAVVKQQNMECYLKEKSIYATNCFINAIPPALHSFTLPHGPLVQLKDVCVSYDGKPILNKINWVIQPGEFWQLTGPNGSGKSTILSLITGDNPKGYGQNIFLFGIKKGSGEAVWDIKQNIGYCNATMTQFFPRLDSAEKMVLSGFFDSVGLYTTPNETQIKTAHGWLQIINLYTERDKPFCFLPLGKQRLVLVARAMVKHPPLLILDEPTVGLDDGNIKIFTQLINKIASESNTTILYVSHRAEDGLTPKFMFTLIPGNNGSIGMVQ